jgi:CHAT domain-containing protein
LNTRYAEEKAHWEAMARKYPALTATQRAPDLTAADLRQLAHTLGATLVEYFQDAGGWGAFVVTPEAVQHIRLPDLNNNLLREMLGFVATIHYVRNVPLFDKWYTAVIAPVQPHLPAGGKVILAPEGALHLLPIGAARNPQSGQYVCDEYTLAYVPSLAALAVAHQQASRPRPSSPDHRDLLCVAYPGAEGSEHYLPNVLPEAKKVAEGFPQATPLYEQAATPDNVVQHAAGHTVVHMACHGSFNANYPDQSGLLLAGDYLTLQRIITDLKLQQTDLFTMSACVTGRVDLTSGDELSGLSLAALTAGARVVVASLWAVNDEATRWLFEQFYAKIQAGVSPAEAMKAAAADLRQRDNGKWKHPYFWAAFQVNGLAYQ